MTARGLQKPLETDAVHQVLAGMQLESVIDAHNLVSIQNGPPAARQFVKRLFDQSFGSLRPGIQIWPGQGAEKADLNI